MKILIASMLALSLAGACRAADDDSCTFDQENQVKWLKEFAAARPGAVINEALREVTFSDPTLGRVTFSRGGCEHFGISVSVERESLVRLSNKDAIAFGIALLARFDSPAIAKLFQQHISDYRFEMDDVDGKLRVWVYKDPYGEMSIEYEYKRSPQIITVMNAE